MKGYIGYTEFRIQNTIYKNTGDIGHKIQDTANMIHLENRNK